MKTFATAVSVQQNWVRATICPHPVWQLMSSGGWVGVKDLAQDGPGSVDFEKVEMIRKALAVGGLVDINACAGRRPGNVAVSDCLAAFRGRLECGVAALEQAQDCTTAQRIGVSAENRRLFDKGRLHDGAVGFSHAPIVLVQRRGDCSEIVDESWFHVNTLRCD
jgi:hypothetical protein